MSLWMESRLSFQEIHSIRTSTELFQANSSYHCFKLFMKVTAHNRE